MEESLLCKNVGNNGEENNYNKDREIDTLFHEVKETVRNKRKRDDHEVVRNTDEGKRYDNYCRRYMCLFSITRGKCLRNSCKDAHSYDEIDPLTCKYGKKCITENCLYIHPNEGIRDYCKRTRQTINMERIPYRKYYQFLKEKKRWENFYGEKHERRCERSYKGRYPQYTGRESYYPEYDYYNSNYDWDG